MLVTSPFFTAMSMMIQIVIFCLLQQSQGCGIEMGFAGVVGKRSKSYFVVVMTDN